MSSPISSTTSSPILSPTSASSGSASSTPVSQVAGLASGIQWTDLINQIVTAETTRQLTPLTNQQASDTAAVTAWNSFQSLVTTLHDAASAISSQSQIAAATATASASASGRSLITATATATATPASYAIQVDSLATAEKLQSAVVASSTAALQQTGSFSVNGSLIQVTANDTLASIRDSINAANTGTTPTHVSASLLTDNDGSARLILATDVTGAEGVRLIDGTSESSGILKSLGFSDGTTSIQTSAAGNVQSYGFSSATAPVSSLVGITTPSPASLIVDGKTIAVDLSSDSLSSIAARINAAGGHASLTATTANGASVNHLEISGSLAGSDSRTLEVLGLSRAGRGAVSQSAVTGTPMVMDDNSAVTSGSLLTSLGNGSGSANVTAGDTITIRGTKADGSAANTTFTITGTSTVADLLSAVSGALSSAGRSVSATLDNGRIRATDTSGGDSQLAFSVVANNESGASLSFGATTTTDIGRTREMVAGTDAQIRIDGTLIRRSTNSISDAITGVTLQLQAAETNAPVSLVVGRDQTTAVTALQAFASAYNGAAAFLAQQQANNGPLATVSSLRATLNTFKQALINDVTGLDSNGGYTTESQAGVSLDKNGLLQVDTTALQAALTSNASAVSRLFTPTVSSTGTGVGTPIWTPDTQPGTYTVHVDSLATAATATSAAFTSYAAGGAGSDTLAIRDSVSGATASVVLTNGATTDQVVASLNTAFAAQQMSLSASKDAGNHVVLTSTAYGSAPTFTVSGAAGGSLAGLATVQAGSDVTGSFRVGATVYAATGKGQQLFGPADSPTAGLSVRYSGATAGADVGTVTMSLGIAGAMERATSVAIQPNDGTIAAQTTALLDNATSLNPRVDAVQQRLDQYKADLTAQFTAMETAMSKIQAQGQWLTGQISQMNLNPTH